jgi:hypothetical protein
MFFFRKKSIILDCFTTDQTAYTLTPISYSTNYYPDWWRQLPKTVKQPNQFWDTGTMKHCRGFIDYYASGITIPMWSDLSAVVGSTRQPGVVCQFASKTTDAVSHPKEQRGDYLPDDKFGHVKLVSPWAFKTKKDINFAWTHPVWNYDSYDITVLPAVVNYKYQSTTHVNMVVQYHSEGRVIEISANQPLVNLLPMTEDKVKIKTHLVDEIEMKKIKQPSAVFVGNYKFRKSRIDELENQCPFKR